MVSYYYLFSLALVAAVQCAHSLPLQPSRHLEQTKRSLTVSSPVSIELVRRGYRVYVCGWNKECSRRFDSKPRVQEHRKKHENNQLQFKCTDCKQAYQYFGDLTRHECQPEQSRQIAALEFLHRCNVKGCKGTFPELEKLKKHKEDHITANLAANSNRANTVLPFEPIFQDPKSPSPASGSPKPKSDAKSKKRKEVSPKPESEAQSKSRKAPKTTSGSQSKEASADRSRSKSSDPASIQSPSRSEAKRLGSQSNPRSKSKSPSFDPKVEQPDFQSNQPPARSKSKSKSASPGPASGSPKSDSVHSPPQDGSGLSPLGTPESTLDWPEPPSSQSEFYKPQPMNSRPSSQSPSPYY